MILAVRERTGMLEVDGVFRSTAGGSVSRRIDSSHRLQTSSIEVTDSSYGLSSITNHGTLTPA